MEEKIKNYLNQIEEEKGIEILLACETGSRAWGFPSPDSDYDVRIIFKYPKDWYLSINEKNDALDLFYENREIDINGWDLRKSLRLLAKSNAAFLERIQSPIIYKADVNFLNEINEIAPNFYSKIATIHHYIGLGFNSFESVQQEDKYKLKNLFYALRAALACLWILERDTLPPIEFGKMLEQLNIPEYVYENIKNLMELKSKKNESYFHFGEEGIKSFIQESLEKAKESANSLSGNKNDFEMLNQFFIKNLD